MARSVKRDANNGQLRIIGGQWRGRKFSFVAAPGLRPTPDRVRETLFNWLAPNIQDARCLDLFAGSGALGFEALSRGAQQCDFVDSSREAVREIEKHLQALSATDAGTGHILDAQAFLTSAHTAYDIVFLDPPFKKGLVAPACALLDSAGLLADGALVYIETTAGEPPPAVPAHWFLHRDKVAGDVAYRLYRADTVTRGS